MNTLAQKISIIEWVIKLQDETLLNKIGMLQKQAVEKWDELTVNQKAELEEAIRQIERGEGVPHHQVMAKLRGR